MSTLDRSTLERKVHEAVNNVRTVRREPALTFDSELAAIARSHSRDMARRNFVGHSTPTGTSVGDRYERHDYDCRVSLSTSNRYVTAGENIAQLYYDVPSKRSDGKTVRHTNADELAHGAVWGWMNSAGHRENLLRSAWRSEGVGVAVDGARVFVTQNFC